MSLDASIGIGVESAYGTAATTTKGYEGHADSWKTTRDFIESVGFRKGLQTARADRRNIVNMGGDGELEVDLLDAGASALLSGVFDTYDGGINDGAGHITHTFTTSTHTTAPSFTAQMIRPTTDNTLVAYTHVGCMATGWTLTSETEKPVTFDAKFDFQDVSHSSTEANFLPVVYPDDARAYDWTGVSLTLKRADGTAVVLDASKFSLTGDLGLNVDRRFLRGSSLKKKPVRAAVPTYEGSLEGDFGGDAVKLYEAFLAGEIISVTATIAGITPGTSIKFEAPAVQLTGESPVASVDDLTKITLPFRVLDPGDGTTAALKVTYVEADPAYNPGG
jgi:hypothetical protein